MVTSIYSFRWVAEAPSLTGPLSMVSYLPRFGQQAYFVSFPSRWMSGGDGGGGEKGREGEDDVGFRAVMTFSANFACKTGGCAPNIKNAGYGANLLPVQFLAPLAPTLF